MDQAATWHGPGQIALDGDPAAPKRGAALHFRPISIVAKRSPSKPLLSTRFIRNNEICYHNLVCVIAVSKSQEFLLKVRRLFIFLDDDAAVFTSTRRDFFDDDARDSTSTTSRCFFRRRRTTDRHTDQHTTLLRLQQKTASTYAVLRCRLYMSPWTHHTSTRLVF